MNNYAIYLAFEIVKFNRKFKISKIWRRLRKLFFHKQMTMGILSYSTIVTDILADGELPIIWLTSRVFDLTRCTASIMLDFETSYSMQL